MNRLAAYIPSLMVLMVLSVSADCDILVYTQHTPRDIEEVFSDMPAKFGPTLPAEGMRAFVVTGEPRNGCGKIKPPPPLIPNFTENWVVLLARYNCSFEEKVRNAQAAGYDGVIVHNVNSSSLEIMSAKNSIGIKIPSVFVSDTAGIIIDLNYVYTNGYFLVLNGDLPFNINTQLLLPFAIIVSLCLLIMIIFLILKCLRDSQVARQYRLPRSSLKKIPTCKFAKGDPYDTCAICLDDYVEGDKLRVLHCAHAYHCKCIDPWLTKNRRVCPVCKRKVKISGEKGRPRSNSENQSDDSDDDRAPLVQSRANNRTTSGGTFQRQSENPFVRAVRTRVTVVNGSEENGLLSGDCIRNQIIAHRRRVIAALFNESENTDDVEAGTNDTQSLMTEGSSSTRPSGRSSRTKSGDRKRRRDKKRQTSTSAPPININTEGDDMGIVPTHSLNDTSAADTFVSEPDHEQGRIGVAALPNTQAPDSQQTRYDYIV